MGVTEADTHLGEPFTYEPAIEDAYSRVEVVEAKLAASLDMPEHAEPESVSSPANSSRSAAFPVAVGAQLHVSTSATGEARKLILGVHDATRSA